jgi:predicted HicB family RNase H-like nuclease
LTLFCYLVTEVKKEVNVPDVQNGSWREKTMNLRVSAEEHRAIKLLATEAGVSIKSYIFSALDKYAPNWREKGNEKQNSPK